MGPVYKVKTHILMGTGTGYWIFTLPMINDDHLDVCVWMILRSRGRGGRWWGCWAGAGWCQCWRWWWQSWWCRPAHRPGQLTTVHRVALWSCPLMSLPPYRSPCSGQCSCQCCPDLECHHTPGCWPWGHHFFFCQWDSLCHPAAGYCQYCTQR